MAVSKLVIGNTKVNTLSDSEGLCQRFWLSTQVEDSAIINRRNVGQTVVKNHIYLFCICVLIYITAYNTVKVYFQKTGHPTEIEPF